MTAQLCHHSNKLHFNLKKIQKLFYILIIFHDITTFSDQINAALVSIIYIFQKH